MPTTKSNAGTILIVDDALDNFKPLLKQLSTYGYKVQGAHDGMMALMMVKKEPPDLILLDVSMPDVDGYEVCEQLKSNPKTRDIPVIFISGLNEVVDKVKGFEAGAVDYIPKPFHLAELLARINTHVTLHNLQKQLESKNQQLQQEIAQRKESDERYRNLFETMAVGVVYFNAKGEITAANPAAQQILSLSLSEMQGKTTTASLRQTIHEDGTDFPGETHPAAVALKTGKSVKNVVMGIFNALEEDYRWINITATPQFKSGENLPWQVYATFSDITDRKQMESRVTQYHDHLEELVQARTLELQNEITERLKAEEEAMRLAAVIEQATVNIFITNLSGDIVYANSHFEKTTGYTVDEVTGQNPRLLKSGYQDDEFYQELWRTITSGRTWNGVFINKHKNGSLYHEAATIFPVRDKLGKTVNYAAVKRDITEQVETEKALRASEERYRHMFQAASVSLWEQDISDLKLALDDLAQQGVTDLDAYLDQNPEFLRQAIKLIKVLDVNNKTLQIYGAKTKEELLGALDKTVATEALPHFKEQILAIARQKPGYTRETFAKTLQGKVIDTLVSMTFPQATAKQDTMLVSITDITSQKLAETTLQQHAQRLQILREIDHATLTLQSPQEIAGVALQNILRLIPCQQASLFLFDFVTKKATLLGIKSSYPSQIMPGYEAPLDSFEEQLKLLQKGEIWLNHNCTGQDKTTEKMYFKGTRSCIAMPLASQGKLLGALTLASLNPLLDNEDYINILREVANSLTVVITQARLHEQIEQYTEGLEQLILDRTRELSILYEVTAVASESMDLQTTLTLALERVLTTLNGKAGAIHLLDETGDTLYLAKQQGLSAEVVLQINSLPAHTGLAKTVINSGEPVVVPNIANNAHGVFDILFSTPEKQTYVGLPMRARGRVVGILSILPQTVFTHVEEITLLISIADQIGVIVESAHLRQKAEQAAVMEERARLARELHDSVTQLLYSMNLFAKSGQNAFSQGNADELNNCLLELGSNAQQALKEMRLLVYELRPPILEQDGLVGALQHRLEAVEERAGVSTRLLTNQIIELPEQIEEQIYSIALEALNNALKHAKATAVTVKLSANTGEFEMTITDNGTGFDVDSTTGRGGIGLTSINERVRKLDGSLTVISEHTKGTTITVTLKL